MQKKLVRWVEILIPQVKVLPRADKNKDFDPDHWTLVVVEQGIGDQILFLSVMEEAINEFKNIFLIVEARMKSIIERSFPNLQVGLPGLLESWQSNALKKNGYIPLGSLPGKIQTIGGKFYKLQKSISSSKR